MSKPPERRVFKGEKFTLLGIYTDPQQVATMRAHLKEIGRLVRVVECRAMFRGEERDAFALYVNPRYDLRTKAGKKRATRRKTEGEE